MENDKILLCEGCLLPIVAPFYSCSQCTFSLHKCCVELPQEVHQHKFHPEHTLFLITSHLFKCSGCQELCSGFTFYCNPCKFYLDVRCASVLNSIISHQTHKHPLVPRADLTVASGVIYCNACGIRSISGFECRTCGFYLHIKCALLPRTIRHRWDEHPFVLSFPPFTYHPEEFYCEDCEDEIDPNHWMYSCQECDQSFHRSCIISRPSHSKYAYGSTIEIDLHPHPLTVREYRSKLGIICNTCGKYVYWSVPLECVPCRFTLCLECAGPSLDSHKPSGSQM